MDLYTAMNIILSNEAHRARQTRTYEQLRDCSERFYGALELARYLDLPDAQTDSLITKWKTIFSQNYARIAEHDPAL